MIKNILNTVITKVLSAVVSILTIVAINHYLKLSGLGFVSLFTNIIFIFNLFNGFLGGSAIVFLIPRNRNRTFIRNIIWINYIGIGVITFFLSIIIGITQTIQFMYIPHIYTITVLFSFITCNALILLAFEKIAEYNGVILFQALLNLLFFMSIKIGKTSLSINDFILSMYLSNGIVFLFSLMLIHKQMARYEAINPETKILDVFKKLLFFGFLSQTATTLQYLNYRISIFFINKYLSIEQVGVYNVAIKISEAIWMVSSSIALVQYAKISNQKNDYDSLNLTIKLSMISFFITLLLTLCFMCMPATLIELILGPGLGEVKNVALLMAVGIVFMGYSTILAHYFSGKGKYHYNIIICFIGLVFSILGNAVYIKKFGLYAAAITSSVVYTIMSFILFMVFKMQSKSAVSDIISGSVIREMIKNGVQKIRG